MTDARDRILGRLSTETAETPQDLDLPVRTFDWGPETCLQQFRRMLEAAHAEVHQVGDDWPRRLAELLHEQGASSLRYGPEGPLATELESAWPEEGPRLVPHDQPIEECRGALFNETDAGLTSCLAGIAETGSLVLWPTPAEPRLLSLVPPIHCALIEAEQIVPTLHELIVRDAWHRGMPTNALLISGPSKSADIEQTLAYGVHGPEALIVLVRATSQSARDRDAESR